jgi:hypothetical protein
LAKQSKINDPDIRHIDVCEKFGADGVGANRLKESTQDDGNKIKSEKLFSCSSSKKQI